MTKRTRRGLPFSSHRQMLDGLDSGAYVIAVRFDSRTIAWFPTPSERILTWSLAHGQLFLALVFLDRAIHGGNWWYALVIPMAWADHGSTSARFTIAGLFAWVAWWILGFGLSWVHEPSSQAIRSIAPWLMLTHLLGAAGKGVTHHLVLALVKESHWTFRWFHERGIASVVETETGLIYRFAEEATPYEHFSNFDSERSGENERDATTPQSTPRKSDPPASSRETPPSR